MEHLHQHSISSTVGTAVKRGKRGAYDACDLVGVEGAGNGVEKQVNSSGQGLREGHVFEDGLPRRGLDLSRQSGEAS